MWLYLVGFMDLYYLLRWYWETQVVSHFRDKYVFITGCDLGFGNLLVRQLDLRGLRVLAACLMEQGAEQLRGQTSDRLETVILDVPQTDSIAAATQWVKEHMGDRGLWGLVNNAGIIYPTGCSEWLQIKTYVNILKVNLMGIEVTLSMLPLVRRARGRIDNVSSILGRIAFFGGVYCSSEYGVEAFSDVLRRELQHFGVKISIVEPGYFRTGMADLQQSLEKMKQVWEEAPTDIKETYRQHFFFFFHFVYYNMTKQGLLSCSTNLDVVTDCMEHALTYVHPHSYSVGWDARFFFFPLSYLPTSLADYILSRSWPKPSQAV
ncbi:LOW QUALITY PROTEIN: 17-beta-hydroxysteroid dehydrogenase type 6 [Dugong dugon]